MVDVYFSGGTPCLYFHDSCAAATIFNDKVAKWGGGRVEVELKADALMGMMVIKHAAYMGGGHQVAVSVDAAEYYRDFNAIFNIH